MYPLSCALLSYFVFVFVVVVVVVFVFVLLFFLLGVFLLATIRVTIPYTQDPWPSRVTLIPRVGLLF